MQDSTSLKNIESQVFSISSENYKSMMLAPDGMLLLGKRAENAAEFMDKFEKGGKLSFQAKVEFEKFKNFVVEKGETKVNIGYKKLLELGVPGHLEFESEADLDAALAYIEQKWMFNRTEKQLSPLKATVPYLIGLAATLFLTGYVIYINTVGGTFRVNIITMLLIKLSEMIGFIGTVLLGVVISAFVIRALWKAFKNPPVELRLEPLSI